MEIDLSQLYSNTVKSIPIDKVISFPHSYLEKSKIRSLDDVAVIGSISKEEDNIKVNVSVSGDMTLEDSISLEEVNYPFSIEIDQILEENKENLRNTLDLTEFLWENIVLEIPLKFTKVEDLSKFHGNGWKLISEEELKNKDNPFRDLLKEFGEE